MLNLISFIVVAFFSINVTFNSISFAEIGKSEFESIKSISERILSTYPREDFIYLGIGRSPTPIVAFLQTEEGTLVKNIPLTNFKYGIGSHPTISPEEEDKLFSHFDFYFPTDSSRKSILLIDYADSGETLASVTHYLEKYLLERHIPQEITPIAMTGEWMSEGISKMFPRFVMFPLRSDRSNLRSIKSHDQVLYFMQKRFYKDVSEFAKFDIKTDDLSKQVSRPEYLEYCTEMKSAKEKYAAGLLNDDFMNTIHELDTGGFSKYSAILFRMHEIRELGIPDFEKLKQQKAILLELMHRLKLAHSIL